MKKGNGGDLTHKTTPGYVTIGFWKNLIIVSVTESYILCIKYFLFRFQI